MSSLLQFSGTIDERGVGLLFYLVAPDDVDSRYIQSRDPIEIVGPKKWPVLYRAFRKPAGMFGCWVLFRYLGETHAPDLSTPIAVAKVPRGAERLSPAELADYWKS